MSNTAEPGPPSSATGRGEQGVIHDIGYRHYDGPRLGRRYSQRSLFTESARGAYGLGRAGRTKVMPMLLFAALCLPALVVAVVVSLTGAGELPFGYDEYVLAVQFPVSIFVASQAPALVSRDLRFRVVSLYFSRPMRRVDYVQAKLAAMASAVFVLLAAPLTIHFVGALLAKLPVGEQAPGYLRALVGAAGFSVVLACIGLVIAALTPRRGLGVAAIISVLVVLSGVQGTVQAIAQEQGADTLARYSGLISPFTLVDGATAALLGTDSAGAVVGLVFCGATVALVAGCYAVLVMRYRRVSIS